VRQSLLDDLQSCRTEMRQLRHCTVSVIRDMRAEISSLMGPNTARETHDEAEYSEEEPALSDVLDQIQTEGEKAIEQLHELFPAHKETSLDPNSLIRLPTPSDNLRCGLHAIRLPVKAQHPRLIPPTLDELEAQMNNPTYKQLSHDSLQINRNHLTYSQLNALLYFWGRDQGLNTQLIAHRSNHDPLMEATDTSHNDDTLRIHVWNDNAENDVDSGQAYSHWEGMGPRMPTTNLEQELKSTSIVEDDIDNDDSTNTDINDLRAQTAELRVKPNTRSQAENRTRLSS
jgi:hypothetical protein